MSLCKTGQPDQGYRRYLVYRPKGVTPSLKPNVSTPNIRVDHNTHTRICTRTGERAHIHTPELGEL